MRIRGRKFHHDTKHRQSCPRRHAGQQPPSGPRRKPVMRPIGGGAVGGGAIACRGQRVSRGVGGAVSDAVTMDHYFSVTVVLRWSGQPCTRAGVPGPNPESNRC